MEEVIIISYLNDFIYCPASIYFHKLYGKLDELIYQEKPQIEGKNAHKAIDRRTYSTSRNMYQGIEVYSCKYNIIGKIDLYDEDKKTLVERKNMVKKIYDGYVFQVYAEYFGLIEQGFQVNKIIIHSMKDNKSYNIKLPERDKAMLENFENIVKEIRRFSLKDFKQSSVEKCIKCIYEPLCDRSLVC